MIRVIIADDEAPARAKLRRWLEAQPDMRITGECADGLSAARLIQSAAPDAAFLDIQMPGLTGLQLAAQLESGTAPLIVFVTAHDAHALKAFDLNAVDYVLKPFDEERFNRTLGRVRERLASSDGRIGAVQTARAQAGPSERLLVPAGDELRLIDSAGIHFLQSDDNYVHAHTHTDRHLLRRTLRDLLLQLGERFVQIHKSTAVNVAEIEALSPLFKGDYEVRLRSGQRLRLSRRYAPRLFALTGR